ncbi:Hypothetical protein CINCED_3A014048 [Cinara cedri]|uniref:FP protein C-terminal domain-containing protein n=1 Tax=Cinara cedri TaxID=506608 RepID=A0A5E4LYK4_9HEMI|nr:Hypothetical protein CINCED_3A014048 [Cinara cedri]
MVIVIKDIEEENKVLKEQNNKLKYEVTTLDKRVPEVNNEDCVEAVVSIPESVGVKANILKAFRIFSKIENNGRSIDLLEQEIYDGQCKETKTNMKIFYNNWSDDKIYMNNSLTQFNRNLFFKAKVLAREVGYKYVWFRDSKSFIKKMKAPLPL